MYLDAIISEINEHVLGVRETSTTSSCILNLAETHRGKKSMN